MITITKEIEFHSDCKCSQTSSVMMAKMDGSQPECPVTFYVDDNAVFTMENCEISTFVDALKTLDCEV